MFRMSRMGRALFGWCDVEAEASLADSSAVCPPAHLKARTLSCFGILDCFLADTVVFQGSVRNTAIGADFTISRLSTCPRTYFSGWLIPTSSRSIVRKGDYSIL